MRFTPFFYYYDILGWIHRVALYISILYIVLIYGYTRDYDRMRNKQYILHITVVVDDVKGKQKNVCEFKWVTDGQTRSKRSFASKMWATFALVGIRNIYRSVYILATFYTFLSIIPLLRTICMLMDILTGAP